MPADPFRPIIGEEDCRMARAHGRPESPIEPLAARRQTGIEGPLRGVLAVWEDVRVERCDWAPVTDPLYLAYHDDEWGVPSRDDRHLLELLVLEGAQAGLSWATILHKREGYRRAFAGFDPQQVARFDARKVELLLRDPGIVRNRLKVESAVSNARAALVVQEEYGSLAPYLWSFVGGKPVRNEWRTLGEIPAETAESRAMSKDMKRRGFSFVGPTICYAFMQAAGLVNDHVVGCFRHEQVAQ